MSTAIPGALAASYSQKKSERASTSRNIPGTVVLRDANGAFDGIASTVADNAITSAKIADGTIVNDDVSDSAAIDGIKIAPNFGSQTITTSGSANINRPSDHWATSGVFVVGGGTRIGQLDTHGSFEITLTSNGYRDNTSGTNLWKSYQANSQTGAAQIGLNPSGTIIFRTDSNKTTGSSNTVQERMRITNTGDVGIGKTPTTALDVNGTVTATTFVGALTGTASAIADSTVTNAKVANTAAIAGTKISPDFGAQNLTLTGQIRSATGAEATPGVTFTGDNDTGIFSPGANTIAATVGGSEACRIISTGSFLVGKTTDNTTSIGVVLGAAGYGYFTRDANAPIIVNRLTDDGTLIALRQAGTEEGTISVSGSTVSYNGAHLSRWSQLPSGHNRQEILRGTLLSNIDEMCVWGDELNEQLNRMKVSDVEGDPNVSGVFQSWDDDDETYTDDFYCAMTGDFIIRIASGTTVQLGDLLMSAGDGTAKPQGDDIVRAKTVAKVTSTQPSCIYADGSYCVPCVLMAC